MKTPIFSVTDLACTRNHHNLFKPVSFTLCAGELLYIAGPNGIGKTTLLRCLAGFSPQASGKIAWEGGGIHFLGHKNTIKTGLTVFENLKWSLSLRKHVSTETRLSALETMGLVSKQDVLAGSLSAGQKQRLALANLILTDSRLWLLDEPFTALDDVGSDLTQEIIQHQVEKGGIVIFTSHQTPRLLRDKCQYLLLEEK